ncbi:MAG TPA: hypothetical protein VGJ14_05405 [Sporichthyaceae bacterium]
MHWNNHLQHLQQSCATAGGTDTSTWVDATLDVVADLLVLQQRVGRDPVARRAVEVAALHVGLAREYAGPVGPSVVPDDLALEVAERSTHALLGVLLSLVRAENSTASYARRLHLRAASRAMRGEPLLPAQRGRGGARTP